jgi:energy-coupling factor transporter ATP-binding protein EcfA2
MPSRDLKAGLFRERISGGGEALKLSVDNLACRRSGRLIFDRLSFGVAPGEALLVTGRNGAGKSSLLAILAGRLRQDGGTVTFEGAGERSLPESLHLVGHRDGLKAALTAKENLVFAQELLGSPALPSQKPWKQWGWGMRQPSRSPISPRASAAVSPSPGSWWRTGPCGSSTNRRRPSTPHRRRSWLG